MSNCSVCNSVIEGNRKGKKYCSVKCKQRAYNARKNGESINRNESTHFAFDHYKAIHSNIKNQYDISYSEYCFILSSIPHQNDPTNTVELILNFLDDVYRYDDSIEIYFNGFENYKKRLYQNSLKTLD